MIVDKLTPKIRQFHYQDESKKNKEDARLHFVKLFPKEDLINLSLEQYAQGTGKDSFCYWLEFRNILFGIGGGNASKFGIYKSAKDGLYYTGAAKSKKSLEGDELVSHYQKLIRGICHVLFLVEENRIEEIKKFNVPIWNMVLLKILAIYYPDKFIMVGTSDILIECAKVLEISEIKLNPENSIQINYECRKKFNSLEPFKDWGYDKIGVFVWESFFDDAKRNYYVLGSKYGENPSVDMFPVMLKKSVISVGFSGHHNMEQYRGEKKNIIKEHLKASGEEPKSYNALAHFLNLKAGDRIAIKSNGSPKGQKGFISLVGIAEVEETGDINYTYSPNDLGHEIKVKYLHAPIYQEFDYGGYGRTIQQVKKSDHINNFFKQEFETITIEDMSTSKESNSMSSDIVPLNQILYGPPGTGKTYNTINKAIKIANPDFDLTQERKIVKAEFDRLQAESRIVFTTFHQSMSYEDFVEGIKPISPEEDSEQTQVSYEVQDGIFKKTAINAAFSISQLTNISETEKVLDFSRMYDRFIGEVSEKLSQRTDEEAYYLDTKSGGKVIVDEISIKGNFIIKHPGKDRTYTVSKNRLTELEAVTPDLDAISNIHEYMVSVIGGMNSSAYWAVLNAIRKQNPIGTQKNDITPVSDENKQRVVEKMKRRDYEHHENAPKYVLIIDEINRGNVSQIFGELITLIEADKRQGRPEALELTLPYSKTKFGVPPNLHIIGTMNTADRSVEALDAALRRRFHFTEMPPDADIIRDEEVDQIDDFNTADILETINNRIKILLDRDHLIGHSYFLKVKRMEDLRRAFIDRIIPLLQEYFYGDYSKIALVLGKGFCHVDKTLSEHKFAPDLDDFSENYEERQIFTLRKIDDNETFIAALELMGIQKPSADEKG